MSNGGSDIESSKSRIAASDGGNRSARNGPEIPATGDGVEYDTTSNQSWRERPWAPALSRILRHVAVAIGQERQHNVNRQTIYQVVLTSEQLKRAHDIRLMESRGTLKGMFRTRDGKIDSIVNLREINPQIASTLISLPIYQAMEEVIESLKRIESGVKEILRGQHADRIGELNAGLELILHASLVEDSETRRRLLQSAVTVLLTAKWKLFEAMRRELLEMKNKIGEGDLVSDLREKVDPTVSREEIASEFMQKLHENMAGATRATIELAKIYAALGEPRAAKMLIEGFVEGVRQIRPEAEIGLKYMTAQGDRGQSSYSFWNHLEPTLKELPEAVRPVLEVGGGPLLITFRGAEILPGGRAGYEND